MDTKKRFFYYNIFLPEANTDFFLEKDLFCMYYVWEDLIKYENHTSDVMDERYETDGTGGSGGKMELIERGGLLL